MKTIGVIGMGPAGLVTIKELKEAGFDNVVGFDRASRIGGRWSLEYDAGVWEELCLNGTRRVMEFSDFTWKDECYEGYEKAQGGCFPHCTEVRAYLEAYAKNFNLYPNIQLRTEVKSIARDDSDGHWTVIVQDMNSSKETAYEFDALVICCGRHAKAIHPLQDMFVEFEGQVLHSQSFQSAKSYRNKKVLVIGSSISGAEISAALATAGCQNVVNSVRRVPYHVSKFSYTTNRPYDELFFIRLAAWISPFLPEKMAAEGFRDLALEHWPDQVTDGGPDLSLDTDLRKAGAAVDVNYMEHYKKGTIRIKPAVSSATGRKVAFEDGSTEEFDAVICATGFETDLSFLPQDVQNKVLYKSPSSGAQEVALYKHTLVLGIENLAFVGLLNNVGSHHAIAEMQARYIAKIFSGKVPRPSDSQLQKGIDAFKAYREAGPQNAADNMAIVCEDIGYELNLTPSYLKGIWNAKKLLISPLYNCYYRTNPKVDGEETATKYQKLFDEYIANPQAMTTEK